MIKSWPKEIYDVPAVIVAVQAELDRAPSSSSMKTAAPETVPLMECLAELYVFDTLAPRDSLLKSLT